VLLLLLLLLLLLQLALLQVWRELCQQLQHRPLRVAGAIGFHQQWSSLL
jgi:hypothetical protein